MIVVNECINRLNVSENDKKFFCYYRPFSL